MSLRNNFKSELIRNCFPQVTFGHPDDKVKNEVADVIISETRAEGKRESIMETIGEGPLVVDCVSTGQEGEGGAGRQRTHGMRSGPAGGSRSLNPRLLIAIRKDILIQTGIAAGPVEIFAGGLPSGDRPDIRLPPLEVTEDTLDHGPLVDQGDNPHLTSAVRAEVRIRLPGLFDHLAPGTGAMATIGLPVRS